MAAPTFLRIYLCFASGYLLSYLFRTVNAGISPELTAELGLSSSSLGLLTSAYFLAFCTLQIPAGILLDRYGPRRVEPVLLSIAGLGALAFAASDGLTGLALARGLIGAGVAVCLMAPLKAIAAWYPPDKQASLSSWMMVAGGTGALLATSPVEAALTLLSWRGIFVVLAVATFAAAALIFTIVPDTPTHPENASWRAQWRGVGTVFRHSRFWWIAPLAALAMGTFMAIQGLWSVPWLIEVEGYSRVEAARHLLLMNCAILIGYLLLGLFASRALRFGIHARHLFAFGFATSAAGLALILLRVPFSYAAWTIYGVGTAVNVLGFTVLNEGFPRAIVGRVNTALNVLMFGTSFFAQWGIGIIVDTVRVTFGMEASAGLRVAFGSVLAIDLIAFAWFAAGWRKHAPRRLAFAPAP